MGKVFVSLDDNAAGRVLFFRKVRLSLPEDGDTVQATGVAVTDSASGIVYTVVPIRDGDVDLLRDYRETMPRGALPDYNEHPLPRLYLAQRAREFLEGETDWTLGFRPNFVPDAESLPRPSNDDLVALVAGYFTNYNRERVPERRKRISPRVMLSERFNIRPRTADQWIALARELAPERIPAPTTGRPRKHPREDES